MVMIGDGENINHYLLISTEWHGMVRYGMIRYDLVPKGEALLKFFYGRWGNENIFWPHVALIC